MRKPICDIRGFITKLAEAKNPDGTAKFTTPQIRGKVVAAMKRGLIDRADLHVLMGRDDLIITDAEFAELEALTEEASKVGGSVIDVLSPEKTRRLVELSNKARNTVGTLTGGRVNQGRLNVILGDLNEQKPMKTVQLLDLLDKAIEKANANGNAARAAEIFDLKKSLMKITDLSTRLKIDFKAIGRTNKQIDKLTIEFGIIKQLLDVGDKETSDIKRSFAVKVLDIKAEIDRVNNDPSLNDIEKAEKTRPLIIDQQKLIKEYNKVTSKKFAAARRRLEKQLKTIAHQIQHLKDNAPNSFLNKILISVTGLDPEFFVTNLRELKARQQQVEDDVTLVTKILEEAEDTKEFTEGDVHSLFGGDYSSTREIKELFYEIEKEADGTPKKDSEDRPIKKKKAFISKADVMKILPIWASFKRNQSYASTVSNLESTRITNVILAGDNKLVSEVDPDDPLRVARSHEEAKSIKVGYQYDPRKLGDRVKGVRDLQSVLQRLSYLSSLPNHKGYISTGMMVGLLGRDAQSLIHKFDGAILDDLELDNPYVPTSETTLEGKRAMLHGSLRNLGFEDSEILAMPEMTNAGYADDFQRVVAWDLEWDSKTGEVIACSLVEFIGGNPAPANTEVIFSAKGSDKVFDKDDAEAILQRLHSYQNAGYKVVGHGTHSTDSDIQRLVSTSGNTKLGMSVAMRAIDTMILSFRNSPGSSFSRHFGPSLENLSAAMGTGSKKSVTGVSGKTAADFWRDAHATGDYTAFKDYILQDSVLAGRNLQEMVRQKGKTVGVKNHRNEAQQMNIMDVVPMWWDTGTPEAGRNQQYKGLVSLYDIQSFRNMREVSGNGFSRDVMYDVSKIRNLTVSMILALMKADKSSDLDTIFAGLNATEEQVMANIDTVLDISRSNHEAYLPLLRDMRKANGNRFLLGAERLQNAEVAYSTTASESKYVDAVIREAHDTLSRYHRNANKALDNFARVIGARERNKSENFESYCKDVFAFSATKFNGKDLTIADFGNGNFDYVPARQVGAGFAQVMLGHIDDGLTLSQDIEAPLHVIDKRRDDAAKDDDLINFEDLENVVEKREFLPITKQNVAFFAPLSMFEQERMYNDYALRERYNYILKHDLSDTDLQAFYDWQEVNPIIEFKNAIKYQEMVKKKFREGALKTSDDLNAIKDVYFPSTPPSYSWDSSFLFDKGMSKADKNARLDTLIKEAKTRFADYLKEQDKGRLEQGRVQRYNLHTVPNNRTIYSRIPTMEEMEEMSLEVAMDLPQHIAIYVHDARTLLAGDKIFIDGPNSWNMQELSSGGPTGSARLAGIHPQMAFMMLHPDMGKDPNLFKDLTRASLEMGIRRFSKGGGWSRTTYWDDHMSGLHHKVAMLWAYFPDESHKQSGGLLNILESIRKGTYKEADDAVVERENLDDYYEKTYDQFLIALDKLETIYTTNGDTEGIAQIQKIKIALVNSAEAREFFKGAVIPVLYEAGYDGVLKGLREKINTKIKAGDSLHSLDDSDLKKIATALTETGIVVQGRLIDEILGLDTEKAGQLVSLFMVGTNRLTERLAEYTRAMMKRHTGLEDNFLTSEASREAITIRIRAIAEQMLPAAYEGAKHSEREKWIQARVALLTTKWQKRINDAVAILDKSGGKIEIGSKTHKDFEIALAGDQSAYKTQLTLRGINAMQNAGIKLQSSARDILEASVFTGRYIADSDLMFTEHVVFTTVGRGTGSGRAQYVGNSLTNLHGGRLSKGLRIVYEADGVTINHKESVTKSAWELVGNPLSKMPKDAARKHLRSLVVKNYLLTVATDYPPTMIGYNRDAESRSSFFKSWKERTQKERHWEEFDREEQVAELKKWYVAEGKPEPTDEEIEQAIKSNSIPRERRIGTRVLATNRITGDSKNVISQNDAKGLAAFRPRTADNPWEDRIVHGLYSMYQGLKQLNTNTGSFRHKMRQIAEDEVTPDKVFDMNNSRATQYDPENLGVYFPEIESSLVEDIFGHRPTFNNKVLRMKYQLDTFAMQNGLEDLVKNKEYAILHQIYQIRTRFQKFAHLLSNKTMQPNEIRFLHRHLVQQIFKLTKAQRDASATRKNILDIAKSIGIDPTKFREEDGSNMRWLDVLRVLGNMGVPELGTIKFGMSPVEMLTSSTGDVPDVLQDSRTSILPNAIQGEDVALLFAGIWADDRVKIVATEYCEELIKKGVIKDYEKDITNKYVLLSSLPPDIERTVLNRILDDESLIEAVAENLGLYVSVEIIAGENRIRFLNSKFHANTEGKWVVPNRVMGATVNRVTAGLQDVSFYLTPEAIKAMLVGAKNAGFFSRIETAMQVNKSLGGSTITDNLRREKYADYLDKHLDELADETDILAELEGDTLKRLETNKLRDKHGTELNLYDAEHYFHDTTNSMGMSPFKVAISLDIRIAMNRAKQYPTLDTEYKALARFMEEEKFQDTLVKFGFIAFVRNNVGRDLHEIEMKALLEEHFGEKMSDAEFEALMMKVDRLTAIMDKVNYSPFKGKNKHLTAAIKHREQQLMNPDVFDGVMDAKDFIKQYGIPPEEVVEAAQAVKEAYALRENTQNLPEAYSAVPSGDLINLAADPTEFANAFPGGAAINTQLLQLKLDGIIDEETEMFYRLLISKVLKHNPHLTPFLSIRIEDLGTVRAGEAVKEGDRFVINLNPNILKKMGRVDQVRVFSHEIAHIARLAFIKDNSTEWRQLVSLVKSRKGAQATEAMLLVMNNNKKYEGFEQDLKYYRDNPEEFIAMWGGWMLEHNVFNNTDVMRFLQSRSTVAHGVGKMYKNAFHRIKDEASAIAHGLHGLDDTVFTEIMAVTENLFGFTSTVEREIHVHNMNQKLGYLGDVDSTITASPPGTLPSIMIGSMSPTQYTKIRGKREAEQMSSLAAPASRNAPHHKATRIEDLHPTEKLEIANTFVVETLRRRGGTVTNPGTISGFMRDRIESVFGKDALRGVLKVRYLAGTWGSTQANQTYLSEHPAILALMHVIGESLCHTTGQFIQKTGSRAIRENRAFSQQWVESLTHQVGQVKMRVSDDEFKTILVLASDMAYGRPAIAPTGMSPESFKLAQEMAAGIEANCHNMKNFIYGEDTTSFDPIPVTLDRALLGLRVTNPDPAAAAEFEKNRKELLGAVTEITRNRIIHDGFMNGTLFHASGIGPRINKTRYELAKDGTIDQEFITEMKRVQVESPGVFAAIAEIAVRQMIIADPRVSEATRRSDVARSSADPNFMVNGSPALHRVWQDAAHQFYRMVDSTKSQSTFFRWLGKMGKAHKITAFPPTLASNFNDEIQAAIVSTTPITTAGPLFVEGGRDHYPPGVSNIPTGKKSVMAMTAQNSTTLTEIMAGLFLAELGEEPTFLHKEGMVSSVALNRHPKAREFLSRRYDTALSDIERSKGFRATSAIAIQDNTGIAGYDIYDILNLFESLVGSTDPNLNVDKKEIEKALKVIRQKLNIEQGIQARRLDEEGNVFTNLLVKWGPDITRLAYGPNLNTASLVMEGVVGGIITTAYNGNPLEFFTDVFTGMFRNLRGTLDGLDTYAPRGLAINMMYGLEQTIRNSRDVWAQASDQIEDRQTWWGKFKGTMAKIHNSSYRSIAEALTQQAQGIVVENLNNGNLHKLRTMWETESITNMSELKRAMNKHNIIGIKPHMAFELKQNGIFEPKILEAYQYMLTRVPSGEAKEGTLNFPAALKWIEEHTFTSGFASTPNGFEEAHAYRAVATMYEATKTFRNLTLVENNPWNADTHSGAMQFLLSFYRQFPNLYFSQKIMGLSGKMDATTFASVLIATTIADLVYNALLMVALGMIPLVALLPWKDEFIFKQKPLTAARLILGRNPIFGVTGNLGAAAILYGIETTKSVGQSQYNRNRYRNVKKGLDRGYDEIAIDAIPQQAFETMSKDPLAATITAMMVLLSKQNLTDQESHDLAMGAVNSFVRFIPLLGELPVRAAFNSAMREKRPGQDRFGPVMLPSGSRPKFVDESYVSKPRSDSGMGPIKAPKGW